MLEYLILNVISVKYKHVLDEIFLIIIYCEKFNYFVI